MARVFVNWPRGPWQGLYVDGKLQDEGHEICLAGPPHDEYREYDFWLAMALVCQTACQ